jgi:hypothetical protein
LKSRQQGHKACLRRLKEGRGRLRQRNHSLTMLLNVSKIRQTKSG